LLAGAHRKDRSSPVYSRDLAATLFDLALLLSDDAHKPEEALGAYAQAADLYRELARPGTDADALSDLAATTGNMGHVRRDVRQRLTRLRPDDPLARDDLAAAWFNVGRMHFYLKHRDEEIKAYEKSRAMRERLVKDYPGAVHFHLDLGKTLINLGYTY